MDMSIIVSLASVLTSAIIAVITLIANAINQTKAIEKQHQYELEIENLRHQNQNQDKLREEQYRVISSMAPFALVMAEDPDAGREDLYSLALHLAACSDPYDSVGEAANALLAALTRDYKNKDKIVWTMLIENCARSVNYRIPA